MAAIEEASKLVGSRPAGADMAEFEPLVAPLFRHANYLPQHGVACRLDTKAFLKADESRYKGGLAPPDASEPAPPAAQYSRSDLRLPLMTNAHRLALEGKTPEEAPTRCKLLPELTLTAEALDDKNRLVRAHAAEALGSIAVEAEKESIIRALKKAAQDEDSYVRQYAEKALKAVLSPKLQVRYAHGRLNVNLAGPSEGLAVTWPLPKEIRGPLRESIDPNKRFPEVLLYRGNDMEQYLAPSGAEPVPRPHETAVAGILECEPGTKDKTVKMTLRDLRFQTVTVPQIGPLDVELDNPPAP
jgi:hypothetical protein